MSKTNLRRTIEKAILNYYRKTGHSVCLKVKICNPLIENLFIENNEIIDVMICELDSTIRCIEIKTSKDDFLCVSNLSFYGDFNYLALPVELYNNINNEDKFRELLWNGIGIMVIYPDEKLVVDRPPKKKLLGFGRRTLLVDSMFHSLAREARKYYSEEYKI